MLAKIRSIVVVAFMSMTNADHKNLTTIFNPANHERGLHGMNANP